MRSDEASETPQLGRRAVVAGGALLATGALVGTAGCAGATPQPPATPASSAPAVPTPAAVGSAGTRLGPASEVPVGGGKVYEVLEVVVTQPTAGTYTGLSAVCTHTGCIVNEVADGTIDCPCHGSRYHLDGTVAGGPAPRALGKRPVTVVDGQLVLTKTS